MNKQFTNASPLVWAAPGAFFLSSMALVLAFITLAPPSRIIPEAGPTSESAGASSNTGDSLSKTVSTSMAARDSRKIEDVITEPPEELIAAKPVLHLEDDYMLGRVVEDTSDLG